MLLNCIDSHDFIFLLPLNAMELGLDASSGLPGLELGSCFTLEKNI